MRTVGVWAFPKDAAGLPLGYVYSLPGGVLTPGTSKSFQTSSFQGEFASYTRRLSVKLD